ncbi:MAG: DEAD/DEAH box helicase family protein [Bacteroidetes bacterium]|nr:DEAD/DEAH box helicase family protein [Bacteroidota bacterium]
MKVKNLISNSKNWQDFKSAIDIENNKVKGDAFELLTKLYFQVNPEHKSLYEEVWLLSEVPSSVLEYLELPDQDLGIDLIVKSGEEYHAIQCKYHSDITSSVTFKEVSTFLSLIESNKKILRGYICSSAFDTSKNFQKLKTKPISTLMSDVWQNLDEGFFLQAQMVLDGKEVKLTPSQPREHQKIAIEKAVRHFENEHHARGKLIFPCGAGKSLTGFWIAEQLKSKSTLVAVPSLFLVQQTLGVYLKEIVANNSKVKWLCICSDEGIGKNDDVVFNTENLGVPCLTDSKYIEQWLIKNMDEKKIIFTTYQSGRIIAEISKKLNFAFDVGIFDEAHKTVGPDKKLFSHLLFEDTISIAKRMFMTATERFYVGSKDDIISMDNEGIYGETFAQMSFKEAIELKLLTNYKVITIDVKKSEIAKFIRDNNLVQLNDKWKKETEARSLASMLALRKAMKRLNIKNAVSFHSSIEKARRNKDLQQYITKTYNYQPIDTYTVSGKDNIAKRNNIVQEFANSEKALITNARCLSEGVDVPNIDCIVFADPRKSKVDIVQALGRALRKKVGKEWGYVILPVIYDEATSEIDNDNFNEIIDVVRALASNDERVIAYFKDKAEGNINAKIEKQLSAEFFSDYLNETELKNNLQIRIWKKLSKFNMMPFEDARNFVRKLGLSSYKNWFAYCESGKKPEDIPFSPASYYNGKGWIDMRDWLGNEKRSFEEARDFVRKLNFKSSTEWKAYCESGKKPDDIPFSPASYYKGKGWKDMRDWIGNEQRPFEEARTFVRKLGLNSHKGWIEYCNSGEKPDDIPNFPASSYKGKGWMGFSDWIDNEFFPSRDKEYMPFEEARAFVRKLSLKSSNEWYTYCRSSEKPDDIPTAPHAIYKDKGWVGMEDWIGKTNIFLPVVREYRPFDEARAFVRKLNLKSSTEWYAFCKSGEKPDDIPTAPAVPYKDKGWTGFGDWLGNSENYSPVVRGYRSFEEARAFVRKLNLKNSTEWNKYCKSGEKPDEIPTAPHSIYKDTGWVGFRDWIGTGSVNGREYRIFEEARCFVRKLNLKNSTEWYTYCKSGEKPDDIPTAPAVPYKDKGWTGFGDWLGTGNIMKQFREWRSFEEARAFVRKLNLKNSIEWNQYCKSGEKPNDIPSAPTSKYKDKGWESMEDWLGNPPYL